MAARSKIDGAYIGPVYSVYKLYYATTLPHSALAFLGLLDDFRAEAEKIALEAIAQDIPPASRELLRLASRKWYRWFRSIGLRRRRGGGWVKAEENSRRDL